MYLYALDNSLTNSASITSVSIIFLQTLLNKFLEPVIDILFFPETNWGSLGNSEMALPWTILSGQ